METITAVFDGKVFVPEEPVELPVNARVRLLVGEASTLSSQERRAAFERLRQNALHGGGVEFDRGDLYP